MQIAVAVLIYSCAKHLPDFLWHASLPCGKLWPGAKQTLKVLVEKTTEYTNPIWQRTTMSKAQKPIDEVSAFGW
jgi:hypothetical protein